MRVSIALCSAIFGFLGALFLSLCLPDGRVVVGVAYEYLPLRSMPSPMHTLQ